MSNKNHEEIEQDAPLPTNIAELDNMATEMWYNYFKPAEPLSKADKKALMEKYNAVANQRNKIGGFKALILITPSTHVVLRDEKPEPKPILKKGILPTKGLTGAAPAIGEPRAGSKIAEIIALHVNGKTNKEIIEAGYNKSTVNRQVSEYKKRQQKN